MSQPPTKPLDYESPRRSGGGLQAGIEAWRWVAIAGGILFIVSSVLELLGMALGLNNIWIHLAALALLFIGVLIVGFARFVMKGNKP